MTEQPKPEIIQGMSFADYCDLDAANATTFLTYSGQSPAEARHEQIHGRDPTESLVKGHATHSAVLEPEMFERDYATMPAFGDFRTKANREKRDAWLEEHKESITLTPGEYGAATAMCDSLRGDPFIGDLFSGRGINEVTLTWTDADTGLACKARIDRLTYYHRYEAIIDLKTARDIDDYSLQKAIANYHYHIRMAWYVDALMLVKSTEFRVMLVWVLNKAPWVGRVTELDEDDLQEGRLQYRRLLKIHAECLEANEWPGYPQGVEPLGLPAWAFQLHKPGLG